jgi:hypothetical protein
MHKSTRESSTLRQQKTVVNTACACVLHIATTSRIRYLVNTVIGEGSQWKKTLHLLRIVGEVTVLIDAPSVGHFLAVATSDLCIRWVVATRKTSTVHMHSHVDGAGKLHNRLHRQPGEQRTPHESSPQIGTHSLCLTDTCTMHVYNTHAHAYTAHIRSLTNTHIHEHPHIRAHALPPSFTHTHTHSLTHSLTEPYQLCPTPQRWWRNR